MAFTPYIPQDKAPDELQDQVVQIMRLDAALHAKNSGPLRLPMMNLLRVVNSYYSNKIEGNSTIPADILRAEDAPQEFKGAKDLQEIKRHIEAQRRLADEPINQVDVCTKSAISRMHREFYVGVPEDMLDIQLNEKGDTVRMVPGEFRHLGFASASTSLQPSSRCPHTSTILSECTAWTGFTAFRASLRLQRRTTG